MNQGQKGPKPERPIPERPNTRISHTYKKTLKLNLNIPLSDRKVVVPGYSFVQDVI